MEFDEEEEHANPQNYSRQHEWEIICGLYKNQFINYNEFKMLGRRDRDRLHNKNTNFVDEDTSNRSIQFISKIESWIPFLLMSKQNLIRSRV